MASIRRTWKQMTDARRRSIYFVVGEPSGDILGADLIESLRSQSPDVECIGLGGERMQALGVKSLFDIDDIAVMGVAAVLARLPTILHRIRRTANDIVARRPDAVVLVDSPDFCLRVAKRVRSRLPGTPIIKYICPSVWAWRPGRAKKMAGFIDHILAILPFEPAVLRELGGPAATYVGHPLARRAEGLLLPDRRIPSEAQTVLLLPGSRRTEIRLLLDDFRQTVDILEERGKRFRFLLPAVPKLEAEIREKVAGWKVKPEIVVGDQAKTDAFLAADAALATSGTVLLELALFRVPMVSIYRLDWLMARFRFLITSWTAALPNLITDSVLVPERVEEMIRPGWLARAIEELMNAGPARDHQLDGFETMIRRMHTDEPAGDIAARTVLSLLR
jgi:lipid-A-disaccharide synthase